MSDENERIRVDIAAATRLLVRENILDYAGHVSARIGNGDRIMIQNRGDSRSELEPGALLIVDMDGKVLEGDNEPPSEVAIHTQISRARPDVNAVLHCHMNLAITFTMMEDEELVPMRARATRWSSGIPVHPDPAHIKSDAQGRALAETLGPHHAVLMRAHGLSLVAETVKALFIDAVHFRENAAAQLEVLQAGRRPVPLSKDEMAHIIQLETRDWHIKKLWNFYTREGLREGLLDPQWGLVAQGSPRPDR